MDKEFIKRGVVLPLICAALVCAVSLMIFTKNSDSLSPFAKGGVISYYDDVQPLNETVSLDGAESFDELESNSLIGTAGDVELRYDADYSALNNSASIACGSALPSQNGCMYIKTTYALSGSFYVNSFTLQTSLGKTEYSFYDELTVSSEQEALSISPALKKSVVVYFQTSDGSGLSSDYSVYIFEGAE